MTEERSRQVVSIVRGRVTADAIPSLAERYRDAIRDRPAAVVRTMLIANEDRDVAVVTVWRDQAALDAMRSSGDEPLARRLIREAGGSPSVEFFQVLASSDSAWDAGPRRR